MAAGNPALTNLMQRLAAMRGGAGRPAPGGPAGPGGPGGGDQGPDAGDMLSQQFNELKGADPEMGVKALTAIKGQLVSLYGRFSFTAPGVAAHVAKAQQAIDKAMEEARKAATTLNTINPPIANRAAMPNPGAVNVGGIGGAGGPGGM